MSIPVINIRKIDQKRLDSLHERATNDLDHTDIWYIHTVLAQCFLPYRNPKTDRWRRQNGKFSISLIAVIRKNYGNDVLPEANYAVLGRRYSVREYLRVDKL